MIDQAKIFWILCFKMEEYGWVSQSHVVAAHTSEEAENIFKSQYPEFVFGEVNAAFITTDEAQEDHPVSVVTNIAEFTGGRAMSTEDFELWLKVTTKPRKVEGIIIKPIYRSIIKRG